MQKLISALIFLGCLGISISAQNTETKDSKPKKADACKNVNDSLEIVKLREMVEFVSCKVDRVLARDVSNGKIFEILAADPNWKAVKKKKFFGFYGHKNAVRSWKYVKPKSALFPQITEFQADDGSYLLDIDNDLWKGKIHAVREVFVHFVSKNAKIFGFRVLRFVPRMTNQNKVAKRLVAFKEQSQKTQQ